jgi:hypothetical protein
LLSWNRIDDASDIVGGRWKNSYYVDLNKRNGQGIKQLDLMQLSV